MLKLLTASAISLSLLFSAAVLAVPSAQDAQQTELKAAEGDAKAQHNLGFMYEVGLAGIPQSYKEAHKWYKKAADQGLADAQFSLGYMYDQGLGVDKDYQIARQWYQKAVQQGFPEAQSALAAMYIEGEGVEQNVNVAKKLYGEACDGGAYDACLEYQKLSAQGL